MINRNFAPMTNYKGFYEVATLARIEERHTPEFCSACPLTVTSW